ncbi:MAG: HAMP domain-containing histidine kinase [Actinobacteria bacterium]|nr:MAG: HAMP domain-containing histidine kinase [Actinomycetota bacterium]
MLRSLRFRLPALFLLGILLSGLVATAIAFRLFQNYTHDRALQELRRESAGAVHLYEKEAGRASVSPLDIERATGDRLFYIPVGNFTLLQPLDALPANTIDMKKLERTKKVEFTLHRGTTTYLAVARPVQLNGHLFGALVVAKPQEELQSRLTPLVKRLAVAFGIGLLVASLLALYLSRRITRPLRTLSRAADEVSRGRYEVEVPEVPGKTEIAQLAERFRGMAERLAEAEELERNFLMTVSHELRTPLTAIQGHVAALREGVFDDEETRAFSLEVIDQEAARLGRLVGDVLDLAKLDAHRFTVLHEEVNMEQLVERAYAAFGEEARRRSIDYRQEILARPVIVTDGDRVLQIISNLLSNAFRWTPEGGRVELSLAAENGAVEVDISDNGPGITAEERERIFRPFWSRDGSGTGLGLAIARELAVALGGRIELDSKPGRGSRFRLVLPAAR